MRTLFNHSAVGMKVTVAISTSVLFVCGVGICGNAAKKLSNTPPEPVPSSYFGMHIHKASTTAAWPNVASNHGGCGTRGLHGRNWSRTVANGISMY